MECGVEVNKRCIKLGLPIKNPELEIMKNSPASAENLDEKTTDTKKTKQEKP